MAGLLPNKIKLLVAEDSQGTRQNLINLLSFEKDIEVVAAVGRATQAIDMASQLLPHVVLMDINLPDLDGLTATARIRSLLPGTAVIIMSVQDEDSYIRRALQAGASAFLTKPFTGDEMIDTIRKAVSQIKDKR